MKKVKAKDIIFNEARPKICVPIIGNTEEEILEELELLNEVDFDVIEWRVDHYHRVEDFSKVEEILRRINKLGKVLLFTFRNHDQGGAKEWTQEGYFSLNSLAIQSGLIDLIDIELFQNQEELKKIVKEAKKNNIKVIISNHDFDKTPPKEEIINRLYQMQNLGADITKIALMPEKEEDVLTLLEATLEMKESKENQPTITISMGNLGKISRLIGESFGSCMTYGALRETSAPGQINIKDLSMMLDLLKP